MANAGSVKQHFRPWEVNQSENEGTVKVKVSWVDYLSTYLGLRKLTWDL